MGASTAGLTGAGLGFTDGWVAADGFAPLSVTPPALEPFVAGTGTTTVGGLLSAGDGVVVVDVVGVVVVGVVVVGVVLVAVVAACDCEPVPGKDRSAKTAATARTRTITRRERRI
jgi:O-antigen ligase